MTPVFIECDGPVRELGKKKYFELIHKLQPNRPLTNNYKKVIKRNEKTIIFKLISMFKFFNGGEEV